MILLSKNRSITYTKHKINQEHLYNRLKENDKGTAQNTKAMNFRNQPSVFHTKELVFLLINVNIRTSAFCSVSLWLKKCNLKCKLVNYFSHETLPPSD